MIFPDLTDEQIVDRTEHLLDQVRKRQYINALAVVAELNAALLKRFCNLMNGKSIDNVTGVYCEDFVEETRSSLKGISTPFVEGTCPSCKHAWTLHVFTPEDGRSHCAHHENLLFCFCTKVK